MKVLKPDGRVVEESWPVQDSANDPAAQQQAGRIALKAREGIVRGFFAVKNPQGNEGQIRALYKVPASWKAEWLLDGTVVFTYQRSRVHVTLDGKATRYEE